jgi:hypothetical protein
MDARLSSQLVLAALDVAYAQRCPDEVIPSTAESGEKKALMRTVVAASAIGTTIEWYDFLIYSTAASLVLNKIFFPTRDPLVGKLLAIGTIGVGFFVRPFTGPAGR